MKKSDSTNRQRLLVLGLAAVLSTAAWAQDKLISVNFNNEKATTALRRIEKLSGKKIQYNYGDVDFKVTLSARNQRAEDVVARMIKGHALQAQSNGEYIVIIRAANVPQKSEDPKKLQGLVTDANGEPVTGAIVRDRSGKLNTVTDVDGRFMLPTDADRITLDITYLGMKPATWHGSRGDFALVVMQDATHTIEDVVVTGYQQLDRRNLTSSVTSKDMSELEIAGVSDVSKMLEGKIPDLVATTGSGEVNATSRIRIRGTSTLIGNREPLWVVDGIILTDPVQLTSDVLNDPDYINRIGNAIAGINPQDIKRVDVLKDAAATALYGTRAANGVIVITTKSGREGKPTVSYSGQFTVRRRPYYTDSKINLMNSAERVQFSQFLVDQHYIYPSGMPKVGYEAALSDYYAGRISQSEFEKQVTDMETMNTDWFDILCHNSFSQDHSVSVSGGSDKVRYYTSVGYTGQDDVIKGSDNDRYTAMTKIDMDLSSKVKLEMSMNGYLSKRKYNVGSVNPIDYAYNTSRAIPAYNDDGTYYYYLKPYTLQGYGSGYQGYNILNELDNTCTRQNVNAVTATGNLRYQPIDDLFFNAVFSANVQNADLETWYGEKSFYAAELRGSAYGSDIPSSSLMPYGGQLSKQNNKTVGWTARLQGNYNKYFGGNLQHNVNVAVGVEASSTHYTGNSYTQRGYYKDRGKSFASNIPSSYSSYWSWASSNVPSITDTKSNMVSAYATLSYSFRSLFTLNANGRYDGSNKFGSRSNEKLLPIWSVSGNADLLSILNINKPWVDNLNLKASYGEQGNMLDGQTSKMVIRKGNMDAYYNEMTSTAYAFANPDLRWEKTHSTNVGLEAGFFHGRLQLETEYYYKNTTDAFLSKTIADVNGYNSYVVNSGTITNSGFNFTVTATPVKLKDFYWILSGNLSKIYNKVKTAPGAETYTLNDFLTGQAVVEGQPVGTFYSYKFIGLNPTNGGPLFDDWEDRKSEIANADEYTTYTKVLAASGRRDPNVTGSLSNTFTYKQWRLGATLLYNFGAKTRLFRLFDGINGSDYSSESNVSRDLLNRWQKPGDEYKTSIPAIIGQGNPAYYLYSNFWGDNSLMWTGAQLGDNAWTMYDYSTARVVSANYVKLSTLSLTYEFSQRQLERLGLERLAITLSGYNLKTWADKALKGQTPTQGGFTEIQLSDTPSWTLGVTVNF